MQVRVIELMELCSPGFKETGLAIEWIKQAIRNSNQEYARDVSKQKIDLVKGQRYYSLPSNLINIVDVKQYTGDENSQGSKIYSSIPRLSRKDLIYEEE